MWFLKGVTCHGCGKKGHIATVCRSRQDGKQWSRKLPGNKSVHRLEENSYEYSDYTLSKQPQATVPAIPNGSMTNRWRWKAILALHCRRCRKNVRDCWPESNLSPSGISLHSYSGESIPVVGTIVVVVNYGGQVATLPLLVVKGDGPSLVGRNWQEIFWSQNAYLNQVLERHKNCVWAWPRQSKWILSKDFHGLTYTIPTLQSLYSLLFTMRR